MNIAYRAKDTGLITAVFTNCDTESPYYRDKMLFVREVFMEAPVEIDATLKPTPKPSETLEDKIKRIVQQELSAKVVG